MEREKHKQVVKIVIGAAWIDGTIQPEEREYIHRLAKENDLLADPEIKLMLSEAKQVQPKECYRWLEEYLNKYDSEQDYYDLLEEISTIVYRDNLLHTEETKLLSKLQALNPQDRQDPSFTAGIIQTIQKIYRLAIDPKKS